MPQRSDRQHTARDRRSQVTARACQAPLLVAVRVPASACSTSQLISRVCSPRASRSRAASRLRPIRRWITWGRPEPRRQRGTSPTGSAGGAGHSDHGRHGGLGSQGGFAVVREHSRRIHQGWCARLAWAATFSSRGPDPIRSPPDEPARPTLPESSFQRLASDPLDGFLAAWGPGCCRSPIPCP